jgi:hypothetical protein
LLVLAPWPSSLGQVTAGACRRLAREERDVDDEELIIGSLMAEKILDPPTACAICGRPLGYSIDDQPDWPTGPMCGECYQSRQLDDEIAWTAEQQGDDVQ